MHLKLLRFFEEMLLMFLQLFVAIFKFLKRKNCYIFEKFEMFEIFSDFQEFSIFLMIFDAFRDFLDFRCFS